MVQYNHFQFKVDDFPRPHYWEKVKMRVIILILRAHFKEIS